MKKWISLLLSLMLCFTLLSFSSAALADETTVTFAVDSVFLTVGKTATAKAGAKPYAAIKKGVTYTTSDESIATVTSKGVVKGVAVGQCQLIATSVYDPSASASIPVQVVNPVTKLTATLDSDTVFVGRTAQLSVAYEPADATLRSVTYSSARESVATVSPDGVVTGIARGTTKITIRSTDGYAKAVVAVTVAQAPESVEISPETAQAAAGRKVQFKATVYPSNTGDKSITWTSADESIATVNSKGQVTFESVGETQITAQCNADPSIKASVPVRGLELAQSIAFDNSLYSVLVGETTQLYTTVSPDSATDKSVTYQVKNKKIATVDENGVVTALSGGKTVVYAYTADGSKKRASTTVQVIVPVTGVSYKYMDVRVGTDYHGSFTATIAPANATNKNMTWVSSDESIATVSGTTNRFKVVGRRWGRCKVTGTTEDGNFTVDVYVDVGTLRHAVSVTDLKIKNGKPYITLRNLSNMDISQVRFEILGYDASLQPIAMSTQGDTDVLEGSYNVGLSEGESTSHGQFTFYHPSSYANLNVLQFCITGWSTDSGYYDHNGKLQYNYNISEDKWEWVTYPADADPLPR
ncbi:MAG TPA: Ig-like domain-containing protein [Candidatus Limiplasma sp.]|nr:Ig-like domain-containing protein [Candidatus Limiplasma sp.]